MLTDEQVVRILKKELRFQTSRSGGKGGQNVNKVETKVTISFDVNSSEVLSNAQKASILKKYSGLVNDSEIQLSGNTHRTQLENKEEAKGKLIALLNKLLKPVKKRVATKPGKAAKERKLQSKKRTGEKKQLRKRPDY